MDKDDASNIGYLGAVPLSKRIKSLAFGPTKAIGNTLQSRVWGLQEGKSEGLPTVADKEDSVVDGSQFDGSQLKLMVISASESDYEEVDIGGNDENDEIGAGANHEEPIPLTSKIKSLAFGPVLAVDTAVRERIKAFQESRSERLPNTAETDPVDPAVESNVPPSSSINSVQSASDGDDSEGDYWDDIGADREKHDSGANNKSDPLTSKIKSLAFGPVLAVDTAVRSRIKAYQESRSEELSVASEQDPVDPGPRPTCTPSADDCDSDRAESVAEDEEFSGANHQDAAREEDEKELDPVTNRIRSMAIDTATAVGNAVWSRIKGNRDQDHTVVVELTDLKLAQRYRGIKFTKKAIWAAQLYNSGFATYVTDLGNIPCEHWALVAQGEYRGNPCFFVAEFGRSTEGMFAFRSYYGQLGGGRVSGAVSTKLVLQGGVKAAALTVVKNKSLPKVWTKRSTKSFGRCMRDGPVVLESSDSEAVDSLEDEEDSARMRCSLNTEDLFLLAHGTERGSQGYSWANNNCQHYVQELNWVIMWKTLALKSKMINLRPSTAPH